MHTTINQASNDKDKGGDNDAKNEINIDEILNDLKKEILRVYKSTIDPTADVNAKQAIDMLAVSFMIMMCIGY